ncbi:MAG: NTP transferase domain-containing protein, partial [Candidatus Omnitrophica bacterium]|nr:NTP transferase domain-containing protein [Candidatus Omnitrophota bacterium]
MKNLYAVILAGGAGTRFWPLSRKSKPKQFLNITGKGTLLQETVARVKTEIKPDNIIVVTNAEYKKPVADQLCRFG